MCSDVSLPALAPSHGRARLVVHGLKSARHSLVIWPECATMWLSAKERQAVVDEEVEHGTGVQGVPVVGTLLPEAEMRIGVRWTTSGVVGDCRHGGQCQRKS